MGVDEERATYPVSMQLDPLRRFNRGSFGLSMAVKRVCAHRTLSTLMREVEHVMYSAVDGTWKTTGNTLRSIDVTVLLPSTIPGSYSRSAQVMAIFSPLTAVGSAFMSHLCTISVKNLRQRSDNQT